MNACVGLNSFNLFYHRIERRGHRLVHQGGLVALDKVGGPAIAAEQLVQFLVRDPSKDRRVCNLVAIEVQDR